MGAYREAKVAASLATGSPMYASPRADRSCGP